MVSLRTGLPHENNRGCPDQVLLNKGRVGIDCFDREYVNEGRLGKDYLNQDRVDARLVHEGHLAEDKFELHCLEPLSVQLELNSAIEAKQFQTLIKKSKETEKFHLSQRLATWPEKNLLDKCPVGSKPVESFGRPIQEATSRNSGDNATFIGDQEHFNPTPEDQVDSQPTMQNAAYIEANQNAIQAPSDQFIHPTTTVAANLDSYHDPIDATLRHHGSLQATAQVFINTPED